MEKKQSTKGAFNAKCCHSLETLTLFKRNKIDSSISRCFRGALRIYVKILILIMIAHSRQSHSREQNYINFALKQSQIFTFLSNTFVISFATMNERKKSKKRKVESLV